MTYAVIRVRGTVNIKKEIKDTLKMLRLNRVNHCVLIPETKTFKGMLQKVKDYVTWGKVEASNVEKLIKERGRISGNLPITEKYIKEKFGKDFKGLSEEIAKGKILFSKLEDVKPVFRLHPPRKGFEGIKRSYKIGGALGFRGKDINKLIEKML